MLNEEVKVEGPTSSSGRNMLEKENTNDHIIESYDWTIMNIWESDSRLDYVTNESYDLDYKRINDADC